MCEYHKYYTRNKIIIFENLIGMFCVLFSKQIQNTSVFF